MTIFEEQELAVAYEDQRVIPFTPSEGMSRMQFVAI